MEKMPLLSVVIPIYNVEKYVAEAIESVCTQSYDNLQIILVNDKSPDGSWDICRSFANKDKRICLIERKENGGLSAARNTGLEMVKGNYVTFVDSDDILHPETFRIAMTEMLTHAVNLTRFFYTPFESQVPSIYIPSTIKPDIYDNPEELKQIRLCLFGDPVSKTEADIDLGGSACMAIYKMDIIRKYNIRFPSDRNVASEDFMFNFDYMQHVSILVMIDLPLYFYRKCPNSLTRAPRKELASQILYTSGLMEKKIIDAGYPERYRHYGMNFAISTLRVYVKNLILSNLTSSEKRLWISELAADPRLARIYREYPWQKLPWKYRTFFLSTVHNNYLKLELLVRISKTIKSA